MHYELKKKYLCGTKDITDVMLQFNKVNSKKRNPFRLILLALLCCQLWGFVTEAKACSITIDDSSHKEQISSYDGRIRDVAEEPQIFMFSLFRGESERVSGSRPTRLLPTNTGRSGSQSGRGFYSNSFNHLKFFHQHFCQEHYRLQLSAASRRLYYVIALRRLLC